MARFSNHHYRTQAIQRRRDPEQDARNVAAAAGMQQRINAHLAGVLPADLLAAEVEQRVAACSPPPA